MNEGAIALVGPQGHKKERIEVQIRLLLFLIKHHNTKVYGGDEVWLHVCRMWASDLVHTAIRLTPGARCTGQWVDPEGGVDAVEKRQPSCHPFRE
jgi:hypothetical protein